MSELEPVTMADWHALADAIGAYPPEACPRCTPHPWHGLPCVRHNNGAPCACETAWEATA